MFGGRSGRQGNRERAGFRHHQVKEFFLTHEQSMSLRAPMDQNFSDHPEFGTPAAGRASHQKNYTEPSVERPQPWPIPGNTKSQ